MKRCAPSRRLEVEPHRVVVPKTVVKQPHSSPETICVICLDRVQGKCYLNNCLHQFCFTCLEKWSEVKSVCPLCQQSFEYALHNVRSDMDYDMHVFSAVDVNRSPLRIAGEVELLPVPERQPESEEDNSYVPTHIIMVDFRQYVYEHRLLSMPVHGNSRKAACTPQYIRSHQQEMRVRLIPWLNRELGVVISIARTQIAIAIERVLSVSSQWHMLSPEFRSGVEFCASNKSELFSWELYNFAASFCSMVQFDNKVKYVVPSDVQVPSHFQQFCASVGTTNPMLSLVSPSLALSPTVQSPVRSMSSIESPFDLSDTDSEDEPGVSLHFKTLRHRRDHNGVDCLHHEQISGEQAVRRATLYTPLGGWTSDTFDYDTENTPTARMQRKKKKLKTTIKSRRDVQRKPGSKLKPTVKKQERNKDDTGETRNSHSTQYSRDMFPRKLTLEQCNSAVLNRLLLAYLEVSTQEK